MDYNQPQKRMTSIFNNMMDLECVMLSEIRERHIPSDFTYMWNLRNKVYRNRFINMGNKLVVAGREEKFGQNR